MSNTEPPELQIDLSAIALPSDHLTLGQLRRRQPTIFDRFRVPRISADLLEALATVHLENTVARRAFAAACAQPDPHPEEDRGELLRLLNDEYCRYGISSGLQQTRELVRALEAAAVRQAKVARGQVR